MIIPGLNIQWPWSELLMSGKKTIETRKYPLPEKYKNIELALIETPGRRGKKEAGIAKARIIGTIVFGESFQYTSKRHWLSDFGRHLVDKKNDQFSWNKRNHKVWGWTVLRVKNLKKPISAPKKRGIVYATSCKVDFDG